MASFRYPSDIVDFIGNILGGRQVKQVLGLIPFVCPSPKGVHTGWVEDKVERGDARTPGVQTPRPLRGICQLASCEDGLVVDGARIEENCQSPLLDLRGGVEGGSVVQDLTCCPTGEAIGGAHACKCLETGLYLVKVQGVIS